MSDIDTYETQIKAGQEAAHRGDLASAEVFFNMAARTALRASQGPRGTVYTKWRKRRQKVVDMIESLQAAGNNED